MHDVDTLDSKWYIEFGDNNEMLQKFRYLIYQYYYNVDFNIPRINKYAIEKWF